MAIALVSAPALAGPGDADAAKGIALARRGDCVKAIPLLEQAEQLRHRPASAISLADCYVQVSELLFASGIYNVVSKEKPSPAWSGADVAAFRSAKKKAMDVDARIPTIRFAPVEEYEDLEIELAGRPVHDPMIPKQVPPDVSLVLVVRARGRQTFTEKLVLNEGERRKVPIKLELAGAIGPGTGTAPALTAPEPGASPGPSSPEPGASPGPSPEPGPGRPPASSGTWIGARYRGVIIPASLFHIFADGARSLVVPGAGLTWTMPAGDAEMVISLSYLSYSMGETPFKPRGGPDTDWELVSSSLSALNATVDLLWSIPLDARGQWTLKLGGGVGVGWTFLGDIHRVQAYPKDGKPADPYTYLKCKGPNNPKGTFSYCNALDKDATHYGDYAEPSWFSKGLRPSIYPWLMLPEVSLAWKVTPRAVIDLGVGASLTGIVTDLGFRVAF